MNVKLTFKDGEKQVLSEQQAKKVIGSINYLKLIKYFNSSKSLKDMRLRVLDRDITINELKSVEIVL